MKQKETKKPPMARAARDFLAELEVRVQKLSEDMMKNRISRDKRNQLESELRVAQQALSHYQQAIKLEMQLQRR